ncbi:MAG: hypothetical protein KGR26_14155, partial [Cyanobacteria bacterium REEB65]|nr:hypothetical protein [Cyanobacteria bacterium REEB65]
MALSPLGGALGPFSGASGTLPPIPNIGLDAKTSGDVMALAARAISLCQNLPPQFLTAIETFVQDFKALPNPDAVDIAGASKKLQSTLQMLAQMNA